jgi:hypothetical protein
MRLVAALALAAACVPSAAAAPPDAPAAPPARWQSTGLGASLEAPAGWTLVADEKAGQGWERLCVLQDAASGAETVVSVRKARAASVPEMAEEVRSLFAKDKAFAVTSTTDVPPTPARPFAGLRVEGTQQVPQPPAPPSASGAPAPPRAPVVLRFRWTQFLGNGREWLFFTTVRATVWSRVADAVTALENGFSLKPDVLAGKGEGLFRDEDLGFSCRYPAGYGVRIPASPTLGRGGSPGHEIGRAGLVAEFAPSGEGPVLSVFRDPSSDALDAAAAADALVAWFTGDEVQGEAEKSASQLSGRSAQLVRARARLDGRDQVVFAAVAKRGDDETFRVQAAGDVSAEEAVKKAFDAFAKSFALLNP